MPNNKSSSTVSTIINLSQKNLKPFSTHPFKAYEGQRLTDMVESIKAHGIISPLIVRAIDGDVFEILSGHNRAHAAEAAGLIEVPCIVKKDLTEDEALLIVTETNLIQRSFADLSHSERAFSLAVRHEAMKHQGRRTDLITEIENLLEASNGAGLITFSPLAKKLNTHELISEKYHLSKDNIPRRFI